MVVKKNPRHTASENQGGILVRSKTRSLCDPVEDKENIVKEGIHAGVGDIAVDDAHEKFDYKSANEKASCKLSLNVPKMCDINFFNTRNIITVGIGELRTEQFRGTGYKLCSVGSDTVDSSAKGNFRQHSGSADMVKVLVYQKIMSMVWYLECGTNM